jgi:hypothetical protein
LIRFILVCFIQFVLFSFALGGTTIHASTEPTKGRTSFLVRCASFLEKAQFLIASRESKATKLLARLQQRQWQASEAFLRLVPMLPKGTAEGHLKAFVDEAIKGTPEVRVLLARALRESGLLELRHPSRGSNPGPRVFSSVLGDVQRLAFSDSPTGEGAQALLPLLGPSGWEALVSISESLYKSSLSPTDQGHILGILSRAGEALLECGDPAAAASAKTQYPLVHEIVKALDHTFTFRSAKQGASGALALYLPLLSPSRPFQRYWGPTDEEIARYLEESLQMGAVPLTATAKAAFAQWKTSKDAFPKPIPVHFQLTAAQASARKISTVIFRGPAIDLENQSAIVKRANWVLGYDPETHTGIILSPTGDAHARIVGLILELTDGPREILFGTRTEFSPKPPFIIQPSKYIQSSVDEPVLREAQLFSIRLDRDNPY